eukprot:15528-Heterococcus_DN1.PRE.9
MASVPHLRLACEAFLTPRSPHTTVCSTRATTAVAALAAGHMEGMDAEQLILKPDTCFLRQPSLGSSMLIRPVYAFLIERSKRCGRVETYIRTLLALLMTVLVAAATSKQCYLNKISISRWCYA